MKKITLILSFISLYGFYNCDGDKPDNGCRYVYNYRCANSYFDGDYKETGRRYNGDPALSTSGCRWSKSGIHSWYLTSTSQECNDLQ